MKTIVILFSLVLLGSFSTPVFAENGDCWWIFCIFEKMFEPYEKPQVKPQIMTPEEIYVKQAEKTKEIMIEKLKTEISSFKESQKKLEIVERTTGTSMDSLQEGLQKEIDLWESIVYTEKDMRENPAKYYTKQSLVKLAMEFYKVKPDGSLCDEDRRWIEDRKACIPSERANKIFYSHDLEWLRYHEFDTRGDLKK